ncbi:MAG: histidinol dehydrogenase [Pseudomonadota bacterium]
MSSLIRTLRSSDADFKPSLKALIAWEAVQDSQRISTVAQIIQHIRERGDQALIEYTQRFDKHPGQTIESLTLTSMQLKEAWDALGAEQKDALNLAAQRIESYHQHQRAESWMMNDGEGNQLGQNITHLDRVGVYVPGGKASYPSSVLMNVLPAKVAGVPEIIMVAPAPQGVLNPLVLAAAFRAGVNQVFTVGGAQAVAALAFGTETIPAVDKVVGPGNAYVAEAKRQVFGHIGIDMIAGPSEILIIADENADPDWVAMDLFSQAEHDEEAQSILLTPSATLLQAVLASIEKLLPLQPRHEVIRTSLKNRGALIQVGSLQEACTISNDIAPEHLELSVEQPEILLPLIKHAGAIFMGYYSSEALGDYCAGPNHVLPTSRSARFSSPLGVYDFQKRSSIIYISQQGAQKLAPIAGTLADGEGLPAHAASARLRINKL